MTLKRFIEKLSELKEEFLDKEIVIEAPNKTLVEPEIKFLLNDHMDVFNLSKDNVDRIVITYK